MQLAMHYTSASQKARVISEAWVAENAYCLRCESDRLVATPRNTQARDFECASCAHPYELKSASSPFKTRIIDGAYASMMRRIESGSVPSFLLMQYSSEWRVTGFSAIHHTFITPEVIQQRKPLATTARRAGWIGCNILLTKVPPEGLIPIIISGTVIAKEMAREHFAKTERLIDEPINSRSWTATLLLLIHKMEKVQFSIHDAYAFETELAALYPSNHHIKAKIRQQLQVLRDAGWVEFLSRGDYRLTHLADRERP